MTEIQIGITHYEFGRSVKVSPSFMKGHPDARALVDDNLRRVFESDKAKHFPTWNGKPKYIQGPDSIDEIVVMKDGSDVPEEVMNEYLDTYADESTTALSFWIRHPECEPKRYRFHQFGWYALVPKEHTIFGLPNE
jgi:hypothetical protein